MYSRYISFVEGELVCARYRASVRSPAMPFRHVGVVQKNEPVVLLEAFSGTSFNVDTSREATGLALSARFGVVVIYYNDFV